MFQAGQKQQVDRRTEVERELEAVEARLGRLVEALVNGGPMETVVAQIKAEEGRKRALVAAAATVDTTTMVSSSLNPSTFGQAVTFTAAVAPVTGSRGKGSGFTSPSFSGNLPR